MTMNTFKEAYEVLSRNAQQLRDQDEPNIDDLLTIVNDSVAAYKVCQERIAAVDAALQAALKDTAAAGEGASAGGAAPEGGAGRPVGKRAAPKASSGFEDMDDDTPF